MRAVLRAMLGATAVLVAAGAAPAAAVDPVRVQIDSGVLVGAGAGPVLSFKGVPYVAAPVGALRWASPKPVAPWSGERGADAYGAICPQPVNANGSPNAGGASGATSEDCLFLNVWTPRGAKHAPVMVWLHGGGNALGAGSLGAYDGSAFVRDGVILVTINYRLGVLGFFGHPALTKAAGAGEPLVAYGVMDQIAALQWVRRNIAAFGGDPANVTLFGESAGGSDTLILMASPLAKGLFAKAIVESGGGWAPPTSLAKAEADGAAVAAKAGALDGVTPDQLRALPLDKVMASANPRGVDIAIDGRLLPRSPSQAFAAGAIAHVPLIIGSNSYEASLMKTFDAPPAAILAMQPAALKAAYADEKGDAAMAAAMFTDGFMGAPARWIAAKASAGAPTWLYHFSYVLDVQRPTSKGAGHASEIPYVFASWDTLGAIGMGLEPSPGDLAVTSTVHACWVAFAKTGRPACPPAPPWPNYTPASDTLMEFDTVATTRQHFRKAQLDAQEAHALATLELGK
ncbi:MAG TPA: carboxylesterase family protein [Caulobacteraceae bacterium]|nr:carboxylesterase family protein [Caulobacteraceae bacterium]